MTASEDNTRTWEERGFLERATEDEVNEVFADLSFGDRVNRAYPICKGTLDQLSNLTDAQVDSPEVWETINSTNEDALRQGGYTGPYTPFSFDKVVE